MKKIGFIGLGIMGKPMSKNLLKAGYQLVVYNRSFSAVDELVQLGAESRYTPAQVAAESAVIFTMLPNSPDVRDVLLGENGVITTARPGTIVIDTSSIAPVVAREIAMELKKREVYMLDAPVSGGQAGAEKASLSIMVGGPHSVFEQCIPLFNALGSSVVHVGEIGAGNVTKLVNQSVVAVTIAAIGEGLTLAAKAGVDPEVVFQAIRGGSAGGKMMEAKSPSMISQQFNPGFRLKLHIKDLANVLETGSQVGAPLPLSAAVLEMMRELAEDGFAECDNSVLVKFFEKRAGKSVGAKG